MYYFIGIKGAGMASLACMLKDLGHEVMGSDIDKHIFTEEQLHQHQIPILSFHPDNIKDHYHVIVGNAFDDDFPEVVAALNNNTVTTQRYHEFLGHLMSQYCSYGVAGSHGKTTTTAMLSAMLKANYQTGFLIGDGTGFLAKDTTDLVVEACEYRRHFLAYRPDFAIITNADIDHVDYFKDEDDYISAYNEFVLGVKDTVVIFGDNPQARKIIVPGKHLYYGEKPDNDVQAVNIVETPEMMSFDVCYQGTLFGHFSLPFVGRHLLWNSLAVITIGIIKGLTPQQIADGLHQFKGAKRRFVIETKKDSVFIDDYAHHPTEVKVTLAAAKTKYPDKKIVAIFKPHRVSRVYYFAKQFKAALSQADVVYLCPFTSIDDQEDGIDIDIGYLQRLIPGSIVVDDDEESAEKIAMNAPACFVFMSSKDIYGLAQRVKNRII